MAEDHYTRELFRQAQDFERLETVFRRGKPTEKNVMALVMAQVCKSLAEVCMMLAEEQVCTMLTEEYVGMMLTEEQSKEVEKKEAES